MPLTVFNVSALDEALRPIGIHLIEQFVWTQVQRRSVQGADEPCLVVVDELWLTLRSVEGGEFLEAVARKGPKYWLGLAVASQEPADCLSSPQGLTIVHNSSTHVLLAMDIVPSDDERALYETRPAEQAARNRDRRQALRQTGRPDVEPPTTPGPESPPAAPVVAGNASEHSWHLFDDLEPEDDIPIRLATRRNPRP